MCTRVLLHVQLEEGHCMDPHEQLPTARKCASGMPDQALRLCMHAATCRPVVAAPFFSLSVAVFLHFLSLFNFLCLWRQAVMELADVEGTV